METIKLNNGVEIPEIGIGTYLIAPADARRSVCEALKMGYRLVDTANAYRNERAVGQGIRESGVARGDIFVSTKLWATEYQNKNAVDETLDRLGLSYVDLLFLHQPTAGYMDGYRMIEKAVKDGKVRAIGISNFEGTYIDDVLTNCEIKPQVIQVEAHPYYTQDELRKTLARHDIRLMSWYPLGHGDSSLLNEKVFQKLGGKYEKTPAQIILRWHTQMGFIVIPGSKNTEHIRDNFSIFDFTLTEEEMKEIAAINKNERYYTRTDEQLLQFASWQPEYEPAV